MGASPQLKNGYTRIANEILMALAKTNLSGRESSFLWYLFRVTYGNANRKDHDGIWATFSNSEWVENTLLNKANVSRTKARLLGRNIIKQEGDKIALQKDHTSWLSKSATKPVVKKCNKGCQKVQQELSKSATKVVKNDNKKSEFDNDSDGLDTPKERKKGKKKETPIVPGKGRIPDVPPYHPEFEVFWSSLPFRKGSKKNAFKAWWKARKTDTDETILAGAKIEWENGWKAKAQTSDQQFIPDTSTWINRRGWEMEVPKKDEDRFYRPPGVSLEDFLVLNQSTGMSQEQLTKEYYNA